MWSGPAHRHAVALKPTEDLWWKKKNRDITAANLYIELQCGVFCSRIRRTYLPHIHEAFLYVCLYWTSEAQSDGVPSLAIASVPPLLQTTKYFPMRCKQILSEYFCAPTRTNSDDDNNNNNRSAWNISKYIKDNNTAVVKKKLLRSLHRPMARSQWTAVSNE